ncbi:MAG TPA: universal stress protein, partial [Longimicrobiales bacterium]|nr:universal stress protein [Longimicrobiales bacterium]
MPFRIRNILVASDLSPSESAVLRSASALAALTEAELHVIHALEEGTLEGPAMEQRIRSAEDDLRANLRRALPATMDVSSSRVWPGSAHKAILERAREVDADLIVIGPHRRRDSRHEALGTTADRLVRTTSIPSMIVRRPIS